MKKGMSLISGVLFLAITVSAVFIVYEIGVPIINKMQAATFINDMKSTFTELDSEIQDIASEGRGSKRVYYLKIDAGQFMVNSSKDWIEWEYETDASIISPRTAQWIGNVVMGSNLNTKAYVSTHEGESVYVLENEHLKVYINKTGTAASLSQISTNHIVTGIWQKDIGMLIGLETLNVTLDNNETSEIGSGYTGVQRLGENLPYATAYAYIDSQYEDYFINITLESGADYIIIEGSVT
jgi:hypothetical protein